MGDKTMLRAAIILSSPITTVAKQSIFPLA
jgi:hypothetical protein